MIKYKRVKYKYKLEEDYEIQTELRPGYGVILSGLSSLSGAGVLTILKGYCWDGPSGPTIDTKNFMRGSLVHDALYQLIRLELLPLAYKREVDKQLRRDCIKDGMSAFRAWYVYKSVVIFGSCENKEGYDDTEV
jgi:hypothetical protein